MVETVRHTGSEMGHLDPSERPTVITFMRGLLESRRIAAGDGNGWGNVDGSSCCTSCMNRTIPGGVASSSPVSRTSVLGWGLTRTQQSTTRPRTPDRAEDNGWMPFCMF